MVPQLHSWASRTAIKRSSAIPSYQIRPGHHLCSSPFAVPRNLPRGCGSLRHPARSWFAPHSVLLPVWSSHNRQSTMGCIHMLLIKQTPPSLDSHPRALGGSLTLSSSAPPFIYTCFSFSRSPVPISHVLNEITLKLGRYHPAHADTGERQYASTRY